MKRGKSNLLLGGLIAFWAIAVGAGLRTLLIYANHPGSIGQVAGSWPPNSLVKNRSTSRPTLLVFLHPKCSCSDATIGELDTLMAKTSGRAEVYAVFVQPSGWSASDVKGKLWRQAASIPGVTLLIDPDAKEARRFGAMTSGHSFLFDPSGNLAFAGGITPSRGHQGDNAGREAAVAFINHGTLPLKKAPVFGCSLFNSHFNAHEEGPAG